jgi:uncharacterized protein YdaT
VRDFLCQLFEISTYSNLQYVEKYAIVNPSNIQELANMYLKQITKNGITRLYFYEAHYEPASKVGGKGRTKQKLVKCLGNLCDLKKQYDDPVAYFSNLAKKETQAVKAERRTTIKIDFSNKLSPGENHVFNVGYGVLKLLYKELELDKFWKSKTRGKKIKYDMELIFMLLVLSRVLYPGSKRDAFENKDKYFERISGFTLDDVYHALDLINEHKLEMQKWIYNCSSSIVKRDLSVSYFDCTNYYFDIGRSDLDVFDDKGNPVDKAGNPTEIKYRKRGPEKNHRPDPIVQMGLLTDRNGIPLAYDLFPGNESEKLHLQPIIDRVKNDFSDTRIIVVADRGLNTSDNIYYLNGGNKSDDNTRDGYIYGQSIRGASKEFKQWVLSGNYEVSELTNDEGEDIVFKHKSRICPKELNVNVKKTDGKSKKQKVIVDQKQMVYYSEKYARKQAMDRAAMVERAKDLIKHPNKYDRITCAGSAAYIQNIRFNKSTGEIVGGKALVLDQAKIEEEAKLDGYYSIVTSELKMTDHEIRNAYRGLSRIEETFKISKSDFSARPVYVSTNAHIDAHFATCFTALVLIRLLQAKLNNKYPVTKTLSSLRSYNCVQIDANTFQFSYFDEILADCEKQFGVTLDNKYSRRLEIRRMLKY